MITMTKELMEKVNMYEKMKIFSKERETIQNVKRQCQLQKYNTGIKNYYSGLKNGLGIAEENKSEFEDMLTKITQAKKKKKKKKIINKPNQIKPNQSI